MLICPNLSHNGFWILFLNFFMEIFMSSFICGVSEFNHVRIGSFDHKGFTTFIFIWSINLARVNWDINSFISRWSFRYWLLGFIFLFIIGACHGLKLILDLFFIDFTCVLYFLRNGYSGDCIKLFGEIIDSRGFFSLGELSLTHLWYRITLNIHISVKHSFVIR